MTVDEQLLYESRVRMRQAALAALAGILLVAAAAIQLTGPHTKIAELTIDLLTAHKRFPIDVVGAVINGLGLCALAATLYFLFGITRARNPELKPFIRILAAAGAVVAALIGVAYAVEIAIKANQFATHGSQTYQQANHLTQSTGLLALPFIGQAAALVLAVGFVLVALNAMRVGLLTRFMGYLGIFSGVLVLFPIGSPVPVVQGFWLLALAYLFSGRWATGVPPAWKSGKAEKWPSSQQLREQRTKAAAGSGRSKAAPKPERETISASSSTRTRAGTSKRKRKRRR